MIPDYYGCVKAGPEHYKKYFNLKQNYELCQYAAEQLLWMWSAIICTIAMGKYDQYTGLSYIFSQWNAAFLKFEPQQLTVTIQISMLWSNKDIQLYSVTVQCAFKIYVW